MTFLVPAMLFGWVPLTVVLFVTLKPHHAVLFSVIGGTLFLPMTGYSFSGFPDYTKATAIALGLVLGGHLSGKRQSFSLKLRVYDLPMIIWCLCPIASSLSNDLGLYDGLSSALDHTIIWGIPYYSGRIYFQDADSLQDACLGIIIGGLLYVPLCLFEVRMSPQLSNIFYGFFPHSFAQVVRGGHFRPIVFMQHGLMVALWMAVSSITAFWCWRSQQIKQVRGIPMGVVVILLLVCCLLSRSINGIFALSLGCSLYYLSRFFKNKNVMVFLVLLCIPCYIIVRTNDTVTNENLSEVVAHFVSPERLDSFYVRLVQENLFSTRAFERPWLGWAGYNRGRPLRPDGSINHIMIDSLWLIALRANGLVGLISLFGAMLIGPWLILRRPSRPSGLKDIPPEETNLFLLIPTIIVILFMIDSLLNGMVNATYILLSGALVGTYLSSQDHNAEGTNLPEG